MKKSNLIFAIALCAIFFLSSLIQILPFEKDLGWAGCFAQSPNYLWVKSAGGTSVDVGNSCSTDVSGNIIAIGYFSSSTITFGTTTLTSAGSWDIFIVKYDANGTVLWAKSEGGNSDDRGYSCSTDASGNIIATGYFGSSSITFGTTTLTNAGGYDMFIVKLDGLTGIEENNFENSFSVFPSPTSRYLTLTLSR